MSSLHRRKYLLVDKLNKWIDLNVYAHNSIQIMVDDDDVDNGEGINGDGDGNGDKLDDEFVEMSMCLEIAMWNTRKWNKNKQNLLRSFRTERHTVVSRSYRNIKHTNKWIVHIFMSPGGHLTPVPSTNHTHFSHAIPIRQSRKKEKHLDSFETVVRRVMICKKKMLSMSLCQIEQLLIYKHAHSRSLAQVILCEQIKATAHTHTLMPNELKCKVFFLFLFI